MKRKVLFCVGMLLTSLGAFAQWTQPVPQFEPMADNGATIQYLYNVEYGGFFLGANDWNTRASVSKEKGYKVKITAQFEDDEKTVPLGTWAIIDSVETQKEWKATFCENAQAIWVDNNSGANWDQWVITSLGDNKYEITNPAAGAGKLGVTQFYDGAEGNTRLWLIDYTIVDAEEKPIMSGDAYTTWAFISPEEYETFLPKYATYRAAIALKAAIDDAKAKNVGIDLSAQEAVYNNTASTEEELKAAENGVAQAVIAFLQNKATVDNPVNFSSSIVNSTFDKIGDFNGWSGDAFGAGGTTSTCAEHYSKNFNTYQDITAELPVGIYRVGVTAFYRAGSISNDWKTRNDASARNAKFYAKSGNDSVAVALPAISTWATDALSIGATTGDNGELYIPNSMKDFTDFKEAGYGPKVYVYVPVVDGKLRIGVSKTTLIDTDWTIVDDFTLEYFGNDLEAYKLFYNQVKASVDASLVFDEGTPIDRASLKEYNEYVASVEASTDIEVLKNAGVNLGAKAEPVISSISAYANLVKTVNELDDLGNSSDLSGEIIGAFVTMILSEDAEEFADAIEELKGAGVPDSLLTLIDVAPKVLIAVEGDYSFSDEQSGSKKAAEVTEYDKALKALYTYAVSKSLKEDDDCTTMLVNPSFDDGFNGWTYKEGKLGTHNVECYEQVVDIYQQVDDVPNGIYSISVQAFERPAANGSFTGDEAPKVFLFMNDVTTPVQNIVKDALPVEEAVNKVNCLIEDGTNTTGTWPCDYEVAGYGLVPNSIDGADYAFKAGRYKQECFGLVNDGKMKIGLTSNGVKAHWVLWANFQLTFRGKNPAYSAPILANKVQELKDSIASYGNDLTAPVIDAAEAAIDGGAGLTANDDKEQIWDALNAVLTSISDTKANIAAVNKYNLVAYDLEVAADRLVDLGGDAATNSDAYKAYDAAKEEIDGYAELSTEALNALVAKIEELTKNLTLAATQFGTEDNPVDITDAFIVNADLETLNTEGWTLTYGSGKFQNNSTYPSSGFDESEAKISNFIEAWLSGTALADGSITQVIANLPAGTYKLQADVIATDQTASAEAQSDVKGAFLFAQEAGASRMATPVGTASGEPAQYSVTFVKAAADTDLTIGLMTEGTNANWIAADNFKLFSLGTEIPTGVNTVATGKTIAPAAIYTIAGTPVSSLQKGINIVRYSDGSVRKVLVK